MTAGEIFRILRKRKWLIVLSLTICLGLTIVGTWLWRAHAPDYTATAYLVVTPSRASYFDRQRLVSTKEAIERIKQTWAAAVTYDPVLAEAVEDDRIRGTDWHQRNLHSKRGLAGALAEDIHGASVPETNYIKLWMSDGNKDQVADIVNAVATALENFSNKDIKRDRARQVSQLAEKDAALRTDIDDLNAKITRVLSQSNLAAMQERRNAVTLKLEALLRDEGEAMKAHAMVAGISDVWDSMSDDERAQEAEVLQALDMDPLYRQFTAQIAQTRAGLDNLTRKYGPDHRSVKDTTTLLGSYESQQAQRAKEMIAKAVMMATQLRVRSLEGASVQLTSIMDSLRGVRSEAKDLERNISDVENMRKKSLEVETDLRVVREKLLDIRLLEKHDPPPVRVLMQAQVPKEIATPKWVIMIVLGVLLGAGVGFGVTVLLEVTDSSIRSPSDIARRIDLPLLGMVPHGDDMEEEIEDFRQVALTAPHSLAAEAFRQIRTNLLFSGPAEGRRTLLITSPAPEDGRTTVVLNLAASMAQAGKRVLIVDANFRQPAIGAMFPDAAEAGLSSALVGQADWRDVVSPSGMPNCDVITSGPLPPNPAELLGSDMMEQIIKEMSAEYDQVLFDGAPVMVVSDACILSTRVDGVVLVVRAGRSSSGLVQKTVDQLSRIGAHVIGAVLQGVRTTSGGYLRKNYETFYEYHQREALP